MSLPRSGAVFADSYRIDHEIGRGAMGVVYQARHLRLDRKVALKVLPVSLGWDESNRERFLSEARLLAGLDHPNILTVYDAGEDDGILYIAMAFVAGSDLHDVVEHRSPLDPARAVSALSQVGAALDFAHAKGLVHRDVKPSNILVSGSIEEVAAGGGTGRLLLADFGLAKQALSGRSVQYTLNFLGTPEYAAPEQLRGEPVGPSVDVYALGCVLYECLTGRRPFEADSPLQLMKAHEQDPIPPTGIPGARGDALDTVIATALAKVPEQRFPSCREMFDAARGALEGGVAAASSREIVPASATQVVRAKEAVAPEGRNRSPGPHRRLASAVLIGILVLAGGAAAGYFASKGTSPSTGTLSTPANPPSGTVCPYTVSSGSGSISLPPASAGVTVSQTFPGFLGIRLAAAGSATGTKVTGTVPRPGDEPSCLGAGDTLIAVDGLAVSGPGALDSFLQTHTVGTNVTVTWSHPGTGTKRYAVKVPLLADPFGHTTADCTQAC